MAIFAALFFALVSCSSFWRRQVGSNHSAVQTKTFLLVTATGGGGEPDTDGLWWWKLDHDWLWDVRLPLWWLSVRLLWDLNNDKLLSDSHCWWWNLPQWAALQTWWNGWLWVTSGIFIYFHPLQQTKLLMKIAVLQDFFELQCFCHIRYSMHLFLNMMHCRGHALNSHHTFINSN